MTDKERFPSIPLSEVPYIRLMQRHLTVDVLVPIIDSHFEAKGESDEGADFGFVDMGSLRDFTSAYGIKAAAFLREFSRFNSPDLWKKMLEHANEMDSELIKTLAKSMGARDIESLSRSISGVARGTFGLTGPLYAAAILSGNHLTKLVKPYVRDSSPWQAAYKLGVSLGSPATSPDDAIERTQRVYPPNAGSSDICAFELLKATDAFQAKVDINTPPDNELVKVLPSRESVMEIAVRCAGTTYTNNFFQAYGAVLNTPKHQERLRSAISNH